MGRKRLENKKERFNLTISADILAELKNRYQYPSRIIERLAREHVEKLQNEEKDGKKD